MSNEIKIGKTASVSVTVSNDNTAIAMNSGDLPVFATPAMVALMEQAACECIAEYLQEDQTTVGVAVMALHTVASPLGAVITASAEIVEVKGREIEFAVSASSGSGEIGRGTHTRAIVDRERFMKKVQSNA